MIAKAKAISYGINDLRYITGESKHKKHPEKIYRVLDNLLPPDLDAMGIWNSMQLTLSQHRPIKNSIIRIELSPSPEHTTFHEVSLGCQISYSPMALRQKRPFPLPHNYHTIRMAVLPAMRTSHQS